MISEALFLELLFAVRGQMSDNQLKTVLAPSSCRGGMFSTRRGGHRGLWPGLPARYEDPRDHRQASLAGGRQGHHCEGRRPAGPGKRAASAG